MKTIVLILLILGLGSCSIPKASFTFINNGPTYLVEITPLAGQDWAGFTINPGQTYTVVSESSNIFFSALTGTPTATLVANINTNYTYDSLTKTYTFNDIP